ncbi:MAG: transposase [Gammaproteobacteria bacterium]|nr:transposase [Gammaproteobacteria bacterium]
MATYRRSITPGATYFFTVNTHLRQPVLTNEPFYQALRRAIRRVMDSHPFAIEAFVILPDHLHCLWTLPPQDADYARRWSLIKRYVSQDTQPLLAVPSAASRQKRRELGLWQRRFWEHQIRDERDFEKHADYIHWNPVKHGYVRRSQDWPYSSFRRFVARGIYPMDWAATLSLRVDETGYGEPV